MALAPLDNKPTGRGDGDAAGRPGPVQEPASVGEALRHGIREDAADVARGCGHAVALMVVGSALIVVGVRVVIAGFAVSRDEAIGLGVGLVSVGVAAWFCLTASAELLPGGPSVPVGGHAAVAAGERVAARRLYQVVIAVIALGLSVAVTWIVTSAVLATAVSALPAASLLVWNGWGLRGGGTRRG